MLELSECVTFIGIGIENCVHYVIGNMYFVVVLLCFFSLCKFSYSEHYLCAIVSLSYAVLCCCCCCCGGGGVVSFHIDGHRSVVNND